MRLDQQPYVFQLNEPLPQQAPHAMLHIGCQFCFIALGIYRYMSGAGFAGLWIAFVGWFLLQAARASYRRVSLAH